MDGVRTSASTGSSGGVQKNISLAFKCSYRRSLAARFLQFDLLTLSPAMATGATQPLSMPRASARSWTKYVARWLLPKTARDACKAQCPCKSDSPYYRQDAWRPATVREQQSRHRGPRARKLGAVLPRDQSGARALRNGQLQADCLCRATERPGDNRFRGDRWGARAIRERA